MAKQLKKKESSEYVMSEKTQNALDTAAKSKLRKKDMAVSTLMGNHVKMTEDGLSLSGVEFIKDAKNQKDAEREAKKAFKDDLKKQGIKGKDAKTIANQQFADAKKEAAKDARKDALRSGLKETKDGIGATVNQLTGVESRKELKQRKKLESKIQEAQLDEQQNELGEAVKSGDDERIVQLTGNESVATNEPEVTEVSAEPETPAIENNGVDYDKQTQDANRLMSNVNMSGPDNSYGYDY